jgi:hypothetical protein
LENKKVPEKITTKSKLEKQEKFFLAAYGETNFIGPQRRAKCFSFFWLKACTFIYNKIKQTYH